jgi:NTP pyrophosphatase (non-canonical NTP hydrolase)
MDSIKNITKKILEFRDERDWKQFHTSKDLAISISLEASEVLEHFQWKNRHEIESYVKKNKKEIGDELADVLNYLILLADNLNIDLLKATEKKLDESNKKYPVEKAKGVSTKYTNL